MRIFGALLLILFLACSGGMAGGGGLSREECTQLMNRITEISFKDLPEAERQAALADTDNSDTIESCVRGETWDRPSFECAMQAKSTGDLNRCILVGG